MTASILVSLALAAVIIAGPEVDASAGGSKDNDYNAKCFVFQDVRLRANPVLHFFSSKQHKPETLGCSPKAPTFELKKSDRSGGALRLDKAEPEMRKQLLDSKLYEPEVVTYFIAHGFLESWTNGEYSCRIKDLVLNNSDANFFILDWSGGSSPANPLDYATPVSATKPVAQLVASFINSLMRLTNAKDATKFHLIGHSLGGQLMGFVGYSVNNVGRITALDPAGPCFNSSGTEDRAAIQKTGHLSGGRRRLSQMSAQLVVAIHTDMALFGLNEDCAHYDIFVNGAVKQPDCGLENLKQPDPSKPVDALSACAHRYSHEVIDVFAALFHGEHAPKPLGDANMPSNALLQPQIKDQPEADARCYEMAYRCDSSEAFELGECGACVGDDDTHCVFIGLSAETVKSAPKYDGPTKKLDSNVITCAKSENGDENFNDEIVNTNKLPGCSLLPSEENQLGHHFVKTGHTRPLSCLFQYQVIVAAAKSADKDQFYLQIPLQKSGQLKGTVGKQNDRLIQVSHKLAAGSEAFARIQKDYIGAVAKQAGSAKLEADNVDFYTALVTFAVASCDSKGDFKPNSDQWELCAPLASVEEALVLAKSRALVDKIQWVALNYLSGVEYTTRLKYSYVFKASADLKAETQSERVGKRVNATKLHK